MICQHGSHAWACVTCAADHVAKIRAAHPSQRLSADQCAERIAVLGEQLAPGAWLGMGHEARQWHASLRAPNALGGSVTHAKASTFTGALRALVRELEKRTERRSA